MRDANSVGQLSPDGRWRWDGSAWQPVASQPAQLPRWLNLRITRHATWAAVASAVAVGLVTDQAINAGAFGLAAALALVIGAGLLIASGGLSRAEPRGLAIVAAAFGIWLVVRASPWLLLPDLVASLLLLGFAAAISRNGSLFDIGTAEMTARAASAIAHLAAGAAFVAAPILESRDRLNRLGPVLRGLVIATPICVLLSILLASADPVFASFFNLNLDLGQLLSHAFFVVVGALAMAGLLRLASAEPVERIDGPQWRLGATEALVVLALLDAVFAAFATAQVLAATGVAADTLKSAGVTYSEYARSGFFQLLWVGGITLVLLILFSRITGLSRPEHRLAFLVLCEIAIALTLMIVVVAVRRLSLYEEAYGFTMLRLYSHIFAGWMAVVFLLLAVELLGFWNKRRWFVGATAVSALAVLLILNVVNPEAVVVALNVNQSEATHKIDEAYLAQLSSDATPALVRDVASVGCKGARSYSPNLSAFNFSDAQAAAARGSGCQ